MTIDTDGPLAMYRELKVKRLADFPTDADLRTMVTVYRGGEPIVNVLQGPGLYAAREALYITAALFRPELLVLVADTYCLSLDDKEEHDHVEQGDLTDRWLAGQRKGLTEALVVQAMDLAGEYRMTVQPYRVTPSGRITWKDPYEINTVELDGALTDAMRQGWADGELWRAKVAQAAHDAGYGMDEADPHIDRAAAMHVAEEGHAVFLLGTGELFVPTTEGDEGG
jgi:hypothetical protein